MSKKSPHKKQLNYVVPGLDRGLEVLEALSQDKRPATVAELTKRLDLPRSSVFRILCTLERKGYVEADASGKAYELGPGVLRLGYAAKVQPFDSVPPPNTHSVVPLS